MSKAINSCLCSFALRATSAPMPVAAPVNASLILKFLKCALPHPRHSSACVIISKHQLRDNNAPHLDAVQPNHV